MQKWRHLGAAVVGAGVLSLSASGRCIAETADGGWDVWVAPYLWALSMGGDAAVGAERADVDVPFTDVLKDLSFGLMAFVDARKERLGFFFNPILSRVGSEESHHGHDIDITNDAAIIAAGAYYRAVETRLADDDGGTARRFILEPYIGARWTYMRAKVDVKGVGEIDESVDWLDPIIGVRTLVDLAPNWDFALGADIGGFGIGSDSSWNAQALFGYRFKMGDRDAILRFGYRALYQDYATGSGPNRFAWDVTQHGPVLGLAVRF